MKNLLFAFIAFAVISSCSTKTTEEGSSTSKTATSQETGTKATSTKATKGKSGQMVTISTDMGDMKVKLYDETPQHRDNFMKLVNEGYYNDLLFHRVIKDFMIQGGDPNSKGAEPTARLGNGGPGYTVPAEINPAFIHKKGALCAARQGDNVNPQKASSGSQFYLVHGKTSDEATLKQMGQRRGAPYTPEQMEIYKTIGGTPFLDGNYTVFGEIVEGLDIVDKIAAVKTQPGDRPVADMKMSIKKAKK